MRLWATYGPHFGLNYGTLYAFDVLVFSILLILTIPSNLPTYRLQVRDHTKSLCFMNASPRRANIVYVLSCSRTHCLWKGGQGPERAQ